MAIFISISYEATNRRSYRYKSTSIWNQKGNNIGVRFSQMLTAFGESFKASQHNNNQPADVQDVMLQKFLETLLENPEKGFNQMQTLMAAQKYLEANGLIEKEKRKGN